MRTTIRMNAELARKAKEFALQRGMTFTEVIEYAVSEHLSRQSQHSAAKRRFKLPVSKARGKPLPREQLKDAIDEADFEYDLKKIGLLKR